MTRFNFTLKAAATMSALALTVAAAPSAFAGDSAYSKLADRIAPKTQAQRSERGSRADRGNRRSDRGTRSQDRRSNRGTRNNDRGNRRNERSRNDRQRDYVHLRDNRNYRTNRTTRRGYSTGYRPASFGNYRRGHGYRHNGFNSNYRSGLGISFSFGSPGYSSYRWAPSSYGLYRPGRVSFASYRNRTQCQRIIVDGFQYGTLRPVSVKQCYNPWDGYYIIQGSERIARNHW